MTTMTLVILIATASVVIGILAFVFMDNKGQRASERLDTLVGKRRKESAADLLLKQSAQETDKKNLLDALTPNVLTMEKLFEQADCNIKPSSLYDYIIWCDASIAVYQVAGVQASFYVPDKNGLQYTVNFSAIEGRGTGLARRACYCTRPEPSSAALAADV